MLATPTPFPQPGSTAYLAPHGEECRIIQHKGAAETLVRIVRDVPAAVASDNRTVARDALFAQVEQALGQRPKRQRKGRG